jgi:YggT family protein
VSVVGDVLRLILLVAILLLITRFIIDWVQVFARSWRPTGIVAAFCEAIYSVTDPPMRAVRRAVPPLRMGGASLDFSPMILLVGVYILQFIVNRTFPPA